MDKSFDYIEGNLIKLKKRTESICRTISRNPKEIQIIAVSKTFTSEAISSALDCNQLDFGENKVQELVRKQKELENRILNWHLVGHLQTNKVKFVVPFVYLIHSVESLKLALKIQNEASKISKVVKCLIQVNTSGEGQKSGCDIQHTLKLIKEIANFENLKVKGLMTIGKFISDDADETERSIVRGNFRLLKNLFDEIRSADLKNVDMKYLSMGMTADFQIALEEGSNMLRIGTAIFGKRASNF
ncbi:MAG: YggS family pyridoxal phosphate-dependent enzyme [Ignavibacteria bacterium]